MFFFLKNISNHMCTYFVRKFHTFFFKFFFLRFFLRLKNRKKDLEKMMIYDIIQRKDFWKKYRSFTKKIKVNRSLIGIFKILIFLKCNFYGYFQPHVYNICFGVFCFGVMIMIVSELKKLFFFLSLNIIPNVNNTIIYKYKK